MAPPEGNRPVLDAEDQDDDLEQPLAEEQPEDGGNPNDRAAAVGDKPGDINIDVAATLEQFGKFISRAQEVTGYALPTVLFGGMETDERTPATGGGRAAGDAKDTKDTAPPPRELKPLGPDDKLSVDDLRGLANRSFTNEADRNAFLADIDKFEKRAETDKITKEDREKFYGQVGRILQNADAGGNKRFTSAEMRTLAADVVRHAAAPGTVNQGGYPTCTAAALEESLYKAEPSTIATVVADVAISGQYKTVDGTIITPPERNLKPDKYNKDDAESKRSSANQIGQIALLNIHWNRQDSFGGEEGAAPQGKKGKLFYEEGHPKDRMSDSQVRIMDHSTTPPTPITSTRYESDPTLDPDAPRPLIPIDTPIDSPSMSIGKISDIYNQLRGHGTMTMVSSYKDAGNHSPETLADFKKLFKQAAAGEGGMKFPIVLGVHANLEPFRSDMKILTPDGSKDPKDSKKEEERLASMHAHHAVAAFDYDPKTGLVTIENQWGLNVDHTGAPGSKAKVHIDDLFKSYKGDDGKAAPKKEAEREEKKPTGDEYIAEQKKFVDELAADSDVSPAKLLSERLTLQRYVQHWKGDAEAQKMMPDIAKDYKAVMADDKVSYARKLSLSEDLLPAFQKAGMTDLVKDASTKLNKSFLEGVAGTDKPFGAMEELQKLIKLHTANGDKESGAKLVEDFVAVLEQRRKSDTKLSEFLRASQTAVGDLTQMGYPDAGKKVLEQLLAENRAAEKDKGDTDRTVLRNKLDLVNLLERTPERQAEYRKMIGELEATYEKMKKDPPPADGRKDWDYSSLQCTLRDFYADTKDTKNLIKITDEIMQRIADSYEGGFDNKSMIGPLAHQAKILMNGGASAEAVAMMEKAYALAKKHPDESRSDQVPQAMADMYRKVGKVKEAEQIERDNKPADE